MAEIATAILMVIGGAFMLLAGIGIFRMPDLFMRMQAATKAATLGIGCMLLAVAIHFQDVSVATRALLVTAFVFMTAPVAAHVIARAAYSVGVPLWEGTLRDELGEKQRGGEGKGKESAGGGSAYGGSSLRSDGDGQ